MSHPVKSPHSQQSTEYATISTQSHISRGLYAWVTHEYKPVVFCQNFNEGAIPAGQKLRNQEKVDLCQNG